MSTGPPAHLQAAPRPATSTGTTAHLLMPLVFHTNRIHRTCNQIVWPSLKFGSNNICHNAPQNIMSMGHIRSTFTSLVGIVVCWLSGLQRDNDNNRWHVTTNPRYVAKCHMTSTRKVKIGRQQWQQQTTCHNKSIPSKIFLFCEYSIYNDINTLLNLTHFCRQFDL